MSKTVNENENIGIQNNEDITEDAELSEEGLRLKLQINSKLKREFTEDSKDITKDTRCSAVQCGCEGNPSLKHRNQDLRIKTNLTFLACKHGHRFADKYRL